jgi:UDP-glucose 6-dehydrogenase
MSQKQDLTTQCPTEPVTASPALPLPLPRCPESQRLGVIGVGTVGANLARLALARGVHVGLLDKSDEAVESVIHTLSGSVRHQVITMTSVKQVAAQCRYGLVLALPSACADASCGGYDLGNIRAVLRELAFEVKAHPQVSTTTGYPSPLFICSTLTPGTTQELQGEFPCLRLNHLPEFLSAATATVDLLEPAHVDVLVGVPSGTPASVGERARSLVGRCLSAPHQRVTVLSATEAECTKLFCNTFYATKVQLFNEYYSICQQQGVSFSRVRDSMVRQGWIHPMHTQVPGPNGQFGFGGHCLPKDLKALVGWSRERGGGAGGNTGGAGGNTGDGGGNTGDGGGNTGDGGGGASSHRHSESILEAALNAHLGPTSGSDVGPGVCLLHHTNTESTEDTPPC